MTVAVEKAFSAEIRRLRLALSLAWAVAWILGITVFAVIAIRLAHRLHREELDSRLRSQALAIYGLAWFDEAGSFHNDLLKYEEELLTTDDDAWVLEPGQPQTVHLGPAQPRLAIGSLSEIAERVVRNDEEIVSEGYDSAGRFYRLIALPTYQGVGSEPIAAIVVVADARPMTRAQASFTTRIVLLVLLLSVVGVAVGAVLARWSLRPMADTLARRERFLAAAAHELRTPLASLQAICDSARGGDESTSTALERIAPLIRKTGSVVEDLLLFARLEAGGAELERRRLRLDLLVEASLPEDGSVTLQATECTVEADSRLVGVAVRNLVENAQLHGATREPVRVTVSGASVVVEDHGPGFPPAILELATRAFTLAPSHSGGGMGLAIAQMIARLHGGSLKLENPPAGGARATLMLA
jgi:signal transduction histidine kinase